MKAKSKEILDLLVAIQEPITKDWLMHMKTGERKYAISFDKLQVDAHELYPNVLTKSTFKTVYLANRINNSGEAVREFRLDRLEAILRFFYVDIATESGWPATTEFLRAYADGKYFYIVEEIANEQAANAVDRALDNHPQVKKETDKFPIDPESPPHVQILQIYRRTKDYYMKDKNAKKELSEALERKDKALALKTKENRELRDDLVRLETLLASKGGDQREILNEIRRIKQKIG